MKKPKYNFVDYEMDKEYHDKVSKILSMRSTKLKTHQVLDLHYHENEGQGCFDGTLEECQDFASKQTPHFMYKVSPLTKQEVENHPDNTKSKI